VRIRLLVIGVLALALAGCGGPKVLARVGDQAVTQKQVDEAVASLAHEAKLEGRPFPPKGTDGRRQVEQDVLGLLERRARLDAKAKELGVAVSEDEVTARLGTSDGESDQAGEEANSFQVDTARSALLYEKLYERVTGGVKVSPVEVRAYYVRHRSLYSQPFPEIRDLLRSQLLSARKNAVMKRWLEQVTRKLPARRG
jgi:hypothetical protein